MKIAIRDIDTKLYLNSGDWTSDIDQAHDFQKAEMAIRHASTQRLNNIEIVYAFPEEKYNFSIGIGKAT